VRLIRLDGGDSVSDVAAVASEEDEPANGNGKESAPPPDVPAKTQPTLFEQPKEKPAAKPAGKTTSPAAKKKKRT
jgi:hypothetical protein